MKDSISKAWLEFFRKQKTFQIKGNSRTAIIFLSVMFGPFGLGASGNKLQVLITLLVVISVFMLLIMREKSIASSLQCELILRIKDIFLISLFAGILHLLGRSMTSLSLTEDELYYSYNGFNQISFVLNRFLDKNGAFDEIPYVHLLIVTVVTIIVFLKTLQSKLVSLGNSKFISLFYSIVVIFQLAYSAVGINAIHNPPAYSLWYMPISTLLGLTHESFRIGTNILFAVIGWLVFTYIKAATNSFLVAFLSLGTFISTPLILQMSGMVEISNFAFVANLVVISKLVSDKLVVAPWMMYFASIMFYFRLTNLALLASLIVLGLIQNRKANLAHAFNAIAIVIPGIISLLFARYSFINKQNIDLSPIMMSRVRDLIELLHISNSFPYLLCFVLFLGFIAARFLRGFIFVFIFTSFYLFFMLILTGDLLSHSKYLIEYIYSFTPLLGFMYKKNVSRSSRVSIVNNVLVVLILLAINIFGLISKGELVEKTKNEVLAKPNEAFSNSYLPQDPFPYEEAYEFLEKQGRAVCLSVGIVYGLVYEVWDRFSVGELKELRRQYDYVLMLQSERNESPFTISAGTIIDSNLTCFILGHVVNKESTIQVLRDSGWSLLGKLVDVRFGSTVYIVVRDPSSISAINS